MSKNKNMHKFKNGESCGEEGCLKTTINKACVGCGRVGGKIVKFTYVTFGQVHVHSVNGKTFDKDSVAVICCKGENHGRDLAFEYFGDKFFTTYFEKAFNMKTMKHFPRGFLHVNY